MCSQMHVNIYKWTWFVSKCQNTEMKWGHRTFIKLCTETLSRPGSKGRKSCPSPVPVKPRPGCRFHTVTNAPAGGEWQLWRLEEGDVLLGFASFCMCCQDFTSPCLHLRSMKIVFAFTTWGFCAWIMGLKMLTSCFFSFLLEENSQNLHRGDGPSIRPLGCSFSVTLSHVWMHLWGAAVKVYWFVPLSQNNLVNPEYLEPSGTSPSSCASDLESTPRPWL